MTTPIQNNTLICMKGTIRTLEKCSCGGKFVLTTVRYEPNVDLLCESCKRRPDSYYIDARNMGAGKIYSNQRNDRFGSYHMAYRQLEAMRKQIDDGTFDPRDWHKRKDMLLSQVADAWLDKQKSRSWWEQGKWALSRHILPALGTKDAREIRFNHAEDLRDSLLDKGLSPKSVKNVLGVLQAILMRLFRRGELMRQPAFPVVEVPEKARGWINREKQGRVVALMPEADRLIFETLIETACRPGEVCALRVNDLLDGEVCIDEAFDSWGNLRSTKSGKVRYSGISLDLWKKLREHSEGRSPEDWLFLYRNEPYRSRRLRNLWNRAAKEAGIKLSLYFGTRHSRASQIRLKEERKTALEISEKLGNTPWIAMNKYARDRKEEV